MIPNTRLHVQSFTIRRRAVMLIFQLLFFVDANWRSQHERVGRRETASRQYPASGRQWPAFCRPTASFCMAKQAGHGHANCEAACLVTRVKAYSGKHTPILLFWILVFLRGGLLVGSTLCHGPLDNARPGVLPCLNAEA
jgi:hypothetical protein